MTGFFVLTLVASILCLAIGIVRPSVFNRVLKGYATRVGALLIFGSIFIASVIAILANTEPITGGVLKRDSTSSPTLQEQGNKVTPKTDKEYIALFIPLVDEASVVIGNAGTALRENRENNITEFPKFHDSLDDIERRMLLITPTERYNQSYWIFLGAIDTYVHAFGLISEGYADHDASKIEAANKLISEANADFGRATQAMK